MQEFQCHLLHTKVIELLGHHAFGNMCLIVINFVLLGNYSAWYRFYLLSGDMQIYGHCLVQDKH